MIRNEFVAEFERPVEDVFAFVDNDDKVKQWIGGLIETTRDSDQEPGVGSRFRQKIKVGNRIMVMDGELLACERNKLLRVKIESDMCEMKVNYHFKALNGRTQLTYTCDSTYRGLVYRLLSPLIRRITQQKLNKDFDRLQRLLQPAPLKVAAVSMTGSPVRSST
jgi:uncharacterized protein YndB with AHSA1/START domain